MSTIRTVKLAAEDFPQPATDPFLLLLVELWRGIDGDSYSVNLNVAKQELRVFPVPTRELAYRIQGHYNELIHWLPGNCDNCSSWSLQRSEAYWSAHAHLCPNCLSWALNYFTVNDHWPEATWYENELDFTEEDDAQDED